MAKSSVKQEKSEKASKKKGEQVKPCLLDDLLITNAQFESEPYVKHFKGK